MTEKPSVAVADDDGPGEVDADLASQRAQLVNDLAWLVVRYHRRCGATQTADRTRGPNLTGQRRNSNR